MTLHLSPPLLYVLSVCVSIWTLATLIANVCTKLTDQQIAMANAISPRLGALVKWSRHWGLDVWPGLKMLLQLFSGVVRFVPAALVVFVRVVFASGAIFLALSAGCTSAGGVDGAQVVTITCDIIAGLDRLACPAAGALLHVQNGTVVNVAPLPPPPAPASSGGTAQ